MTKVQKDELLKNLIEFALRASSKEATAEEIAILPAVVEALMKLQGALTYA